jgi:hypothetical protein
MGRNKKTILDFLEEIKGNIKKVEMREESKVIICDLRVKRLNETILLILSKYFNLEIFSPSESKDFFLLKENGKDVGFIIDNHIHFSLKRR